MAFVFVIILLVVIVVFGYSSGAQSYATAQQAQAQIEVAKVAQINGWGNLVTILTVAFLILVVVLLLAAIAWFLLKVAVLKQQPSAGANSRSIANREQPMIDNSQLTLLVQMKILDMLESRTGARQLQAPEEEQSAEEPFSWLK